MKTGINWTARKGEKTFYFLNARGHHRYFQGKNHFANNSSVCSRSARDCDSTCGPTIFEELGFIYYFFFCLLLHRLHVCSIRFFLQSKVFYINSWSSALIKTKQLSYIARTYAAVQSTRFTLSFCTIYPHTHPMDNIYYPPPPPHTYIYILMYVSSENHRVIYRAGFVVWASFARLHIYPLPSLLSKPHLDIS